MRLLLTRHNYGKHHVDVKIKRVLKMYWFRDDIGFNDIYGDSLDNTFWSFQKHFLNLNEVMD